MLALSRHQKKPSAPPLSSSCTSHRSERLQTSNPCNHRNQQYSIIGLTNAAGTLVERYSYTAYGTLGIYDASGTVRDTSTCANRYTYTGREYDADLNLYHFRPRWYDPATGGFISRDPLGFVDGMSLYRGYFGLNGIDPMGLLLVRPGLSKSDTNCGAFKYQAVWSLSPNERSSAPGYVIQMVCMDFKYEDCGTENGCGLDLEWKGTPVNTQKCESGCYLEYWRVNEKGQVGEIEWEGQRDHDYFAFCGRKQSKGSAIIQGVALFVSDAWLTKEGLMAHMEKFGTGDKGVASAGSLPSVCLTEDTRAFWDILQKRASELLNHKTPSDRSIQRRAASVWDCCPPKSAAADGDSCATYKPSAPAAEYWKKQNESAWEKAKEGVPWWGGENPMMPDFF